MLTKLLLQCVVGVGLSLAFWQSSLADDNQPPPPVLPGTDRLTWEDPLDVRLMDGAHRLIERKIRDSVAERPAYWQRDLSSPSAYRASIAANRERFGQIIGAVNRGRERNGNTGLPAPTIEPLMERIADDHNPAVLAEADTGTFRVIRVRWPVLHGVHGEGLLLEPKVPPVADVIVIPDADRVPEALAGLAEGLAPENQLARRLAQSGCRVIVPQLIDRGAILEGNQQQTRREWTYRQAFHMGRHIIGYEVEKVQAALDWLQHTSVVNTPTAVAGYGEGGLIAFYTSAIDPRIDATLVSGYFGPREDVWREPIYRNVWSLLRQFGDAEIATLIAPRPLIIEYSPVPEVVNQKGDLHTPSLAEVQRELDRIDALTRPGFQPHELVTGPNQTVIGPFSSEALRRLTESLGIELADDNERLTTERALDIDFERRQQRLTRELDDYTQWLVRDSDHVRNEFMLYQILPEANDRRWSTDVEHSTSAVEPLVQKLPAYRDYLRRDILGEFDDPLLPFNTRSRLIAEQDDWIAYDVVLDVIPDLIAWGVLMLPKDLREGERRPVVVVQHGRNGLPENVMNGGYNQVAWRLLKRGYLVFAPHNLYRGEDRYRWLDRKANTVQRSLFSFILIQHDQITRWLDSLAFVDGERIAFYGNSYGGETAVRIPPLLPRYALSICASDFNDWTRKVADTHDTHSFMTTIEWEMPYFNMGSTFSYAELAYLMLPRPFMVERGHHDRVAPDQWVAYEFAKVRWLYDQLGLGDRCDIEFFQGGHTMKGNRTFEFLDRHLKPSASGTR